VLAPTTATGLPLSALSAIEGRESQSTAFFSPPGIEELYSGVAKNAASASLTAARMRATAAWAEAAADAEDAQRASPG
jgi:hypothetical protein